MSWVRAADAAFGYDVTWRRDVATTVVLERVERKDRRFDEASGAAGVDGFDFDVDVDGAGNSDQEAAEATRESTNNMIRIVILINSSCIVPRAPKLLQFTIGALLMLCWSVQPGSYNTCT